MKSQFVTTLLLLTSGSYSSPPPTSSERSRRGLITWADTEDHAAPPTPTLAVTSVLGREVTTQGSQGVNNNQYGIPEEEYLEFFQLVDNFLWDSEDKEEGRQFHRGLMRMNRPQFLMTPVQRRYGGVMVQQPNSLYRSFTDTCYDLLCQLGINSVVNRLGRLLMTRV